MNKESYKDSETDIFWENFKLKKFPKENGSYQAVVAAYKIAWLTDMAMMSDNGKTGLDNLLLKKHQREIEDKKAEIIINNIDNSVFLDTFQEICSRLTKGLGLIPTTEISVRRKILEEKIKEMEGRVDLI